MKYIIPANIAVSDTGFLFLPTTGETFTLNETGRLLFKLIKEGKKGEELIESVTDEFDIDAPSAERDLNDFLAQLKNYNLIKEE